MFATNFYETRIFNTLRGVTAPGVTSLFAGLFFNSPGETGAAGVEVDYAGYSRQPLIFGVPADENNGRGIRNSNEILFPLATSDVGTVHYIGIFDSVTGGNMLLYGALEVPLQIDAQNRPNIMNGDVLYWIPSATMSNAFKDRILNNLRGTAINGFTPRYGLYNGNPEQSGAELSGTNYARPEIVFSSPTQQEGEYARVFNSNTITFNSPGSNWGMWTHDAILGPATGSVVPESGGQVVPFYVFANPIPQTVHVNYVVRAEPQGIVLDLN